MIKTFKEYSNLLLTEALWDKTGILKGKNLLYHWVKSFDDLLAILDSDYLRSSTSHWGAYTAVHPKDDIWFKKEKEHANRSVVCFTRNPLYNIHINDWCLVIDKDLLIKDGIKMVPFSYHGKSVHNQFEEFHLGNLKNIKKYIIGIGISNHLGLSETYYNTIPKRIFPNTLWEMESQTEVSKQVLKKYSEKDTTQLENQIHQILGKKLPLINFFDGKEINPFNVQTVIEMSIKSSETILQDPFIQTTIYNKQVDITDKSPSETLEYLKLHRFFIKDTINIPETLVLNYLKVPKDCKILYIVNPFIKKIEFEAGSEFNKIYIKNTEIESLNLPNANVYNIKYNSFLKTVSFLDNIYTERMDLSYNGLTNIDITKIKKIVVLILQNNFLENIEIPKEFQYVDLENNPLKKLIYWKETRVDWDIDNFNIDVQELE